MGPVLARPSRHVQSSSNSILAVTATTLAFALQGVGLAG